MAIWVDDYHWWSVGISFVLLLARFLTAAGVVRMFVQGTGLGWGVGLAVTLSLCLAPLGATLSVHPPSCWHLVLLQEVLLGLWMGFALALLIVGMQFVGRLAFSASPWGLEPGGTPAGPLHQLFLLITIAGFLHVQGDRIALQSLLDSLQRYPIGENHMAGRLSESVVAMISVCLSTSLQLAAPLMAAVLFAHLLLGLISRSLSPIWLPVLNQFTSPLLLIVLTVGMVAWASGFSHQLSSLWQVQLLSAVPQRVP